MVRSARLRQALTGSTLLFGAMMGANALNYLYAVLLGRRFGPEGYGAYASFMSLFLLVTLLPLTLQQVLARFVAEGSAAERYVARLALVGGTVAGGALAFAAKPLSGLLDLPAPWLVGLGVLLPVYALLGVYRGEAQGRERFGRLGGNLLFETAGKIALTPLALLAVPGASGAVLATLASLPLALVPLARRRFRGALDTLGRARVRTFARPIFGNLAAQAVIVNSDVLLVNALLPAGEAGLYAAVALVGRAVFYGSWAVGAAVFPMVARQGRREHGTMLVFALAAVGLACGGVTLVCALAPELVVRVLVGEAYLGAAVLVAPYALMTSLYALANVVSNHYLALGNHLAGYLPAVFAALQVGLILAFHDTTLTVVTVQIVAKGLLLGALLVAAASGAFSKGEPHVVPSL